MSQRAEQVGALMQQLANPSRLMILCLLVEQERSVGALAKALAMRDAAVSQQLAVLRRHGILRRRRDGHVVYYALAREDVRRMMTFLYHTFCEEHCP